MAGVIMLALIVVVFVWTAWNWVSRVDRMKEEHPDYKGEDLIDEDINKSKNK